jgi:hypothetical protein
MMRGNIQLYSAVFIRINCVERNTNTRADCIYVQPYYEVPFFENEIKKPRLNCLCWVSPPMAFIWV